MSAPARRTTDSLESELSEMYRMEEPPAHVTSLIDGRVATALVRGRARRARSPRRIKLLAAGVALVTALAFNGGAVAQRVHEVTITIIDGIAFSDDVTGRPGLTNFGQPFWGTDIFDRTPAEAAEMAAGKGYTIRWQIEDRGGTESFDDDETTFSEEAPPCGETGGGSVLEEGRIQMVVIIDDPTSPESKC